MEYTDMTISVFDMNIYTLQTWKKQFNPTNVYITDYIGGRLTIESTLIHNGLIRLRELVRLDFVNGEVEISPKKIVLETIQSISKEFLETIEYIVYYVWKARDYHDSYISIYYKPK
jgi:hypothetical protein